MVEQIAAHQFVLHS